MQSIRIVNYAVNGSGVGHLTRLLAVSRWMRRYASYLGHRAEIYFLTSSEADGMLFAERFASFKVPSKTVVGDAGIDKTTYLALAKQWIWHSLGLLRPDLLVVDTFPRGSFGELLAALDLVKKRAFVYRPTKAAFARRPDFQAMLPLYDAILVPEREEDAPLLVPDGVRGRVRHFGPVLARERCELLPRDEARARLGIPEGRRCVYVTAGGGGDPGVEAHIDRALAAVEGDDASHVVIGAGPLCRARPRRGPRVTWIAEPGVAELALGFDVAVASAGYNTTYELLQAGVPTVFLPQEKVADEQARRAERAAARGAAQVLAAGAGPEELGRALDVWRDPARHAEAAAAGRALVERNHAREMAAELLRMVLPVGRVDVAEEALDDAVLGGAAPLETTLGWMRCIEGRHREGLAPREVSRARDATLALLSALQRSGVPAEASLRAAEAVAKKLEGADPPERARRVQEVLLALAPFGDWTGAAMWVQAASDRRLPPDALAADLVARLDGLVTRGADLYVGLQEIARAGGPRETEETT